MGRVIISVIDVDCPAMPALKMGLWAGAKVACPLTEVVGRPRNGRFDDMERAVSILIGGRTSPDDIDYVLTASRRLCYPLVVHAWCPTEAEARALVEISDAWGYMAMPPDYAPVSEPFPYPMHDGRTMNHELAWRRGAKFIRNLSSRERSEHRLLASPWPQTIEQVLGIPVTDHIERAISSAFDILEFKKVGHGVPQYHVQALCTTDSCFPWRSDDHIS